MDPGVAQLEDASLQSCHESLHVQQDRVEPDPSLIIRRSARRIACLLLHLESCQTCDKSSNVDHSLHNLEKWHGAGAQGWLVPQKKSETATAPPQERGPNESQTP